MIPVRKDKTMKVAFFGCWKHAGHHIYDPHGVTMDSFGPFIPESLDGVLLRKGHRIPGQVDVTCFKDHTVIAFIDNTVDRRPGGNGAFIVEGYGLTKKECWAEATKLYPQIVERLKAVTRQGD